MPTTKDVAVAFESSDLTDSTTTTAKKTLFGSPSLAGRKRFQTQLDDKVKTASSQSQQQQQQHPSLIPINRNDANPQRVQGNQSPIGEYSIDR